MTTKTEGEKGHFDALLEEIGGMAKALPAADDKGGEAAADDKKIVAAAAEGGAEGADADDDAGEGEGEGMAKSFKLKLEDGTEVDAVDGAELFKSLTARVETHETGVKSVFDAMLGHIKAQGEMIKSLAADVKKIGSEGRGRKAVVTITEKPAATEHMAKSEPEGVKYDDFMAKSLAAQAAGKLTGLDIARIESHMNRGVAIPQDIVSRVLG